jgi:hypothetical protein
MEACLGRTIIYDAIHEKLINLLAILTLRKLLFNKFSLHHPAIPIYSP